jgi:hypothetical protein
VRDAHLRQQLQALKQHGVPLFAWVLARKHMTRPQPIRIAVGPGQCIAARV